jgi:hypothetical protein
VPLLMHLKPEFKVPNSIRSGSNRASFDGPARAHEASVMTRAKGKRQEQQRVDPLYSTPEEAFDQTFAMPGKSQPPCPQATTATFYVPDEAKAHIDNLHLEPFSGTLYRLTSPTGEYKTATFQKWHGAHALFYVEADDVTVAVWFSHLPSCVKRLVEAVAFSMGAGKTVVQ